MLPLFASFHTALKNIKQSEKISYLYSYIYKMNATRCNSDSKNSKKFVIKLSELHHNFSNVRHNK